MVYVNPDKKERAEVLVGLLTGKIKPRNEDEVERIAHFSRIIADEKIDLKGEKAVEFFYLKFGGLLRTEEEEKKAQDKKKEIQSKGKKDRLGLK